MFRLDGRTALVTGAGSGIGAAVAVAFSRAGASVLVSDIDVKAAQAVSTLINSEGGRSDAFALDVRDATSAQEAVKVAANLNGDVLNILVNNAGAIAPAMFTNLTEESFRRIVDIHLVGSFVCSSAAQTLLANDGTGRIINVTSAAGLVGTIGQANYSAAKAGIVGLTKSLARELASRAITVNALAPLAATAMTQNIRENEKLAEMTLNRIPLRRWAEPEEISSSFVFMASDAASYITGQVLPVDGGLVM